MWWLVGLGAGAGAGLLSGLQREKEEKELLEYQKKQATKQYEYGKQLSEREYAINKGEAHYQLGQQENALHDSMGMFTDQFNTNLLAQAFSTQDARIENASGIGMSRAAEGAGGTRGMESNELMRAYSKQGLEQQVDIQHRQNNAMLTGAVQDANRTMGDINYERNSWEAGGYRHNLKTAQDKYNENIYQMGQDHFDQQIDWATLTGMDHISNMLAGGVHGAKMGNDLNDFFNSTDIAFFKNMAWDNLANLAGKDDRKKARQAAKDERKATRQAKRDERAANRQPSMWQWGNQFNDITNFARLGR